MKKKQYIAKKPKIEERSPRYDKTLKLVEQLRKLGMKKNEHTYPNLQRSPDSLPYF